MASFLPERNVKTVNLTRDDLRTDVWRRLTQTLEAEVQHLRELNDSRMDEVSTAEVRGQIKAFKELLALAKASAPSSDRPDIPASQLAELQALGIDLSET